MPLRRLHRGDQGFPPRRPGQTSGNDVADVKAGRGQKDFFHSLIVAFHHQQPHQHRRNRHADVFGDPKQFQAQRHSGELRQHVPEVGGQYGYHDHESDAKSVFFANEIAEPFAGDGPHACRHLLHYHQRHGHGNDEPQQKVAELGPRLRIGGNAAGVVVDVGSDNSRSDHSQEKNDLDSPPL